MTQGPPRPAARVGSFADKGDLAMLAFVIAVALLAYSSAVITGNDGPTEAAAPMPHVAAGDQGMTVDLSRTVAITADGDSFKPMSRG